MDSISTADSNLSRIEHFVVLMLENRSFDHLLGPLKAQYPAIDGALPGEFSNHFDPADPTSALVATGPVTAFAMPFDPGHEFQDVQIQLYGRTQTAAREPAARAVPAPMSGFIYSAEDAAPSGSEAGTVMQCFPPEKLPVLTALATEFAVFDGWHSSLPGPTWPNRFFVHAATSGGLSDSPKDADILQGYTFPAGTIHQRFEEAGKTWRIYHDGLPQAAGIDRLRVEFLDVFTKRFREMESFESDLRAPDFPNYVFIEPNYDTGHQYVNGNSMHPLNDVRKGEQLIKRVYEAIRASRFWESTLLIVTFDEHGGFFDHVPPPSTTSPGGDERYKKPTDHFEFDVLGIRVPAIAVSAYTPRGMVIGRGAQEYYDHTSILATLQKRFGLRALTQRDAQARTLEPALTAAAARLTAQEAPLRLPSPLGDGLITRLLRAFRQRRDDAAASMSVKERVQLTLAHACDLHILDPEAQQDARRRYLGARSRADAAAYIQDVEQRIRDRRGGRGAQH